MADKMNAIIVDEATPGRLVVTQVAAAKPRAGEITVRVAAVSLNRGEVKRALTVTPSGTCPGWDFVGVVEEANGVPGAPPPGTRVVGAVAVGAWAELVHVSLAFVAVVPDAVSDAHAATLPVAGLTALHALRKGGLILGKKVLIDGASGGVGQVAIQLAATAGARVYAHVRSEAQRELVAASSTGGVVVGPTLEAARPFGPFDLILDSVGGSALSAALTMLRRKGICVSLGRSEGEEVRFDLAGLFDAPGASLQSLVLFDDIMWTEPAADGLAILLRLVEQGALRPRISVEAPWTEVATIARQLIDRDFTGKAVLRVG